MSSENIKLETITATEIGGEDFRARWGACGCEYVVTTYGVGSKQQDFQDLMIYITEQRAVAVEDEVLPMESRMRTRNKDLECLGEALSAISAAIDTVDTSKKPEEQNSSTVSITADGVKGMQLAGITSGWYQQGDNYFIGSTAKATLDSWSQLVKTKTDRLNNDSSQDSTRLQSLVDHRDQAYQTATSLMTSISDTRGNLIRNI